MDARAPRSGIGSDAGIAAGIALLLSFVWTLRDWADLSVLHLPDTDDAARLQQIRDWIAGQSFFDVSQHRIADGLAMHWSRLPDLVPGGIIALASPLIGVRAAEMTAVIAWPTMLFAAALLMIARIARRVGPAASIAPTAVIVAAIGYPVTTLFAPGRIDHHGLQIVLMLIIVARLLGSRTAASGAIAGLVASASVATGMEMAPFLAIAALWLLIDWLRGGVGSAATLAGFGAAMLAGAIGAWAAFAGNGFEVAACDGFTRPVWLILTVGGAAATILGGAGHRIVDLRRRLAATAVTAVGALAATGSAARVCLSPYGAVDPFVASRWLDNVGEAQSLFAAPLPIALGYIGLLVAGIIAGIGWLVATKARGWAVLLSFQLGALAVAAFELRGVYLGAIVGVPALAATIGVARRRGSLPLVASWLGSAGMLYPIAAQALPSGGPGGSRSDARGCTDRATLAALRRLAPGTLLAPIDLGAYALAETRHRVIAAPYHRNNAGNAALYRFMEATPDEARTIAQAWRVDYVVACDPMPDGRFADRLRRGAVPGWLTPIGPGLWQIR